MNNIRTGDLNLLKTFDVLLEERNVSRAAERLALTQPTVSGMLSRLREMFDDPLFIRTQHGMLPTPRAEDLGPRVSRLLADANALLASERFDPWTSERTITISVNDYMQSCLIVPFVRVLREEAPRMRLVIRHLEVVDLRPMLERGQIDMAITIPEFSDPTLQVQALYEEEYVAVVREDHPIGRGRISVDRFLSFDHVVVSPSDGALVGPADAALAQLGRERRVALSVPSFLVLKEILETDDLIAFVPRRLIGRHPARLRQIRAPVEIPGFSVIAAWHNRTHRDPSLQWVRERLTRLASDEFA